MSGASNRVNANIAVKAAAILLLLPVVAGAQSSLTFVPSVNIGGVYDGNLFAEEVAGSAGKMLQIRPSIEGNFESPRLTFLSLYSFDALYSNHRTLNTLDARRHALVDTRFRTTPATTLGIAARYDRTETPGELNFDSGILSDRRQAERWQVTPSFARRFGPLTTMTAGYDYTSENLVDSDTGTLHQGRVALSRELTSRLSISGSYLARHFVDSVTSHTSNAVLGGVERELGAGTRIAVHGGPRVSSYHGIAPELNASLARTGLGRIGVALDYWHGETIVLGIQGPVNVDSATARFTFPLTRTIELGTHAGAADITTIDEREAKVYRGTLITSWTPHGSMYTFAASYGVDYQIGDIRRRIDENVLRHVVRVSMTIAPRLVHSILPPEEAARTKGVSR